MDRPSIAFLVAALVVPVLVAVFMPPQSSVYGIAIGISAAFSFGGVYLLGLPAYTYLCARKWTAFWIAPLAGLVIATVTVNVFNFLFALTLSASLWDALFALINPGGILVGFYGAAVGALVWLIARPDRTYGKS